MTAKGSKLAKHLGFRLYEAVISRHTNYKQEGALLPSRTDVSCLSYTHLLHLTSCRHDGVNQHCLITCRKQGVMCSTRRVQLALLALCLGLCGRGAHGWIPRRGRGQAQLTPVAAGNRHLKSHPHASGGGLPHQEAYHSRCPPQATI